MEGKGPEIFVLFFFFKQKTAYEIVDCDWSSDVCSSDLFASTESTHLPRFFAWGEAPEAEALDALQQPWDFALAYAFPPPPILLRVLRKIAEIGRASCRERV